MTFREIYDAIHVRGRSSPQYMAAVLQVGNMRRDIWECWVEYKQARRGRH